MQTIQFAVINMAIWLLIGLTVEQWRLSYETRPSRPSKWSARKRVQKKERQKRKPENKPNGLRPMKKAFGAK